MFHVMGKIKDKWVLEKWKVEFSDRNSEGNILNIQKKAYSVAESKVKSVLNFLATVDFFNFTNDSLNYNFIQTNDSLVSFVRVTDGCSDDFVFRRGEKKGNLNSYEAEYTQQQLPILQREKFIKVKKRFVELFAK
jgi:hypothetical protein